MTMSSVDKRDMLAYLTVGLSPATFRTHLNMRQMDKLVDILAKQHYNREQNECLETSKWSNMVDLADQVSHKLRLAF